MSSDPIVKLPGEYNVFLVNLLVPVELTYEQAFMLLLFNDGTPFGVKT